MFIVDRFEGDWAIIETDYRATFRLPINLLPSGIKEGDVINITAKVDQVLTEKRKRRAEKLLDNFFDE